MSGADHPQQEKSRKRPMEEHSSSANINLKVKGQDGVEVFFRIQRDTKLLKLLLAYCQKRNLVYKTIRFLYEGELFPVKRSPNDLGMKDGDEIDAMMHHNGGGCVDCIPEGI